MKQLWIVVMMAFGVVLASSPLVALTVDTIPFDGAASVSHLVVDSQGDLWFTAAILRLMHIREGQLVCVCDSDDYTAGVTNGSFALEVAPDGTIYINGFRYQYRLDTGLSETGIAGPSTSEHYCLLSAHLDADERMFSIYYLSYHTSDVNPQFDVYELYEDASYARRTTVRDISSVIAVSASQFWIADVYDRPHYHPPPSLVRLNLDAGTQEESHPIDFDKFRACALRARDSEGRLWISGEDIVTFDGEELSVYAPADTWIREYYRGLSLAGDGTVWVVLDAYTGAGIARLNGNERRVFNKEDGLLAALSPYSPVIDYDGNVWILSSDMTSGWDKCLGISMISDGGWPPMRLILEKVETPETVAVTAQVINNGPVVGVDVYIAIELNGQLLFYPTWEPVPFPNQVNLRPGHNQTATIVEMPRESVPPGTYTVYGCMTGRGTQKLIGPIGRKFEAVVVEVE